MRKFKLKKDLPGLPEGTTLKLDDNTFLTESGDEIGLYSLAGNTKVTLNNIQDASFSEWLEEIKPEYKRWRAEPNEIYFFVDGDMEVLPSCEGHCPVDDNRHRCGNYFQTREEAQAVADYLKALAVVRDDAKGFKPDWADDRQSKYYVCYLHEGESLCLFDDVMRRHADNGVFGLPYFETAEDTRASIDKHEKEWKTIFGVKDDE